MKRKINWIFVCAGLLVTPSCSWAQGPIKHDFDGVGAPGFQMVTGKASNGSTVETSTEKAHSGQKSIKVHYQFTGAGYLQFLTTTPIALNGGNSARMSVWIHGTGLHAIDGAAIRFIDARGETFQYRLTPDFANALNGDGWKQVETTIELTQPNGHWGDNSDGIADLPMKFLGFAFDRSAAEPIAGSVYLDDFQLEPTTNPTIAAPPIQAAKTTVSLQPVWSQPTPAIFIYAPGTQVALRAKVSPAPGQNRTLQWTARDFDNGVVAQGKVPVNGENIEWNLPAGTPGIWYVSAEVRGTTNKVLGSADTRVAFASVAKSPTPALPLLWGVCSHPEHCTLEEVEREAAVTSALGFTAMRGSSASWLRVQPNNAQEWNWETSDKMFAIFDRYNVKILQGFLGTPRWATTGDLNAKEWQDWAYKMPKNLADLAAYQRNVAQRYDKYIVAYEVWNEPDISFWRGTPEEYSTLFTVSRDAIKSVNPAAKVMNGGFSETKRQPDFIPYFTKNTKEKPDIFAYHTHQQFSNLVRAGDDIKNYLSAAKWDKTPVWLNEAGFSSSGRLTERDQASTLIKKYSYSAALGYEGYFWYDLRNDGTDASELEHNFGLVRRDFIPKASAVAARTLTSQIGGKRFVRRLAAPAGVYALLFEGKGATGQAESTAVVWNEATSGSQVPLFWKVPAAGVRTTAMGVQSPIKAQGGVTTTTASPMPEFITINGAAAGVSLVQNVLDFDGAVIAAAGSNEKWKLVFSNPLNKTLLGQLKLSPQDGWKVAQNNINFSLAPNAKREFLVDVSAPATATMSTMKLEITSPSLPTSIQALTRLLPAVSVPRLPSRGTPGDFGRWTKPTVRLSTGNIISRFEATPMQNLHFHGDADLSADVNLARVPEGLLLSVRVQDDIHVQKEAPMMAWQDDSLQFALALPTGESYEWLAALSDKGPILQLTGAPTGVPTGASNAPITIRREGTQTLYEVLIPSQLPGNNVPLPDRFSFTLLVNDNDGAGRKGWAEWTPGIGMSKDPTQFQPVAVQ